jgi:hypothetical protein
MESFEQVSDAQMLQKYDTSFPKAALDSIIKTVSTLSDKKFINKIVKLLLIEKRDTTTIPSIGELLRPSVWRTFDRRF